MDCTPVFRITFAIKNILHSYDLRNHKELYSRNPKTDMELKLFHMWDLKSGAKFQKLLK